MKKIMVLYETAGGGHYAAAKAIEAALASLHPGHFDVVMFPVRAATGSQRVGHLFEVYNHLLRIKPSYSNMGMRVLNHLDVEKVIMPLLPKARRNLEKTIREARPDMIVSVFSVVNHSAIQVLKDLGWYGKVPYIIWCTDLTRNFLKNWANPEADLIIALHDEARSQLIDYGVPERKIRVLSGLPVNQKFLGRRDAASRLAARQALELDETTPTVLISMGGVAVGATYLFSRELARSGLPIQLIAVCGRNERLRARMEKLARSAPIKIRVEGFTDRMHVMMDAADILIGKPGPGTIAEAIAKELPILIDAYREPMLQEQGNLDLVVRQGLGQRIDRDHPLVDTVRSYIENQDLYHRTLANLRRAKNDKAIEELIGIALEKLPGWPPRALDEPGQETLSPRSSQG
jgi:UDP-N-acetylglucosamine:LPS N-acetylglucosamine transferase